MLVLAAGCWDSGGADLGPTGILTFGLSGMVARMSNYKAIITNRGIHLNLSKRPTCSNFPGINNSPLKSPQHSKAHLKTSCNYIC